MRRTGACHRAPVLCLVALALAATAPCLAAAAQVQSETIVRLFERDTSEGDGQKVLPVYEYLRLDMGELEEKGLSFHAYGWGRYDLARNDYFKDDAQGEILYGYLQYSGEENNLNLRLGRQYVFDGVSNESVDGVRASADLTDYFSASVYGGQPVALETVNGRSGDRIWGGRIGHRLGRLYELGLSYKRVDNDGDKQEEVLGIDSALNLGTFAYLHGYSVRSLQADVWQEHSYEARVPFASFVLRPSFERFDYDGYFDTGANTAGPFRFLKDSNETVTSFGGDLTWSATDSLELGARGKHYNYRERSDNAWYYAGLATWHGEGLSQAGAELGRMDGQTDDTAYTQLRGFYYRDLDTGFFSADVVYVRYDEDILDQNHSLFASAAGGVRLHEDQLEVSLSGDYSVDPYFDRDLRGMLNLKYRFEL